MPPAADPEPGFELQIPQPGKADAAAVGFLPEENLLQIESSLTLAIADTEAAIQGLERDIARLEQENAAKSAEISRELARIEARKRELERNQTWKGIASAFGILAGIVTANPALIIGGSVAGAAAMADDSRIRESQRIIDRARQEQARIQQALADYRTRRDGLRAQLAPLRDAKDELLDLLRATAVAMPEGPSPELNAVAWRVDLLRRILTNNTDQIAILEEIQALARAMGGAVDAALETVRQLSAAADELLEASNDEFHRVVALFTSGDPLATAMDWLVDELAAQTREVLETYSWELAEFVDFLIDNRASGWTEALDDLRQRLLDRLINALSREDDDDPLDPTEEPAPETHVPVAVAAGMLHTCALDRAGVATCWGETDEGAALAPAEPLQALGSSDDMHACGIRLDGTALCWGGNGHGQADAPPDTFLDVTAGFNFSCGIRSDATLACWGDDSDGQSSPPEGSFVMVSAGSWHACGIRSTGDIACWGVADYGILDAPEGRFIDVSAGMLHTCAIHEDGRVQCWGYGEDGQTASPQARMVDVSAGSTFNCGVLWGTDELYCWGGFDPVEPSLAEVPGGTFVDVSAGYAHACGVRSEGEVVCWGMDDAGQASVPGALDLF